MQLSQWMKEQNLSVNAMSKQCGIPRQTINNARSGNIDIALRTAMTIVKFTKNAVTYEDLTRKNDEDEKRNDEREKNQNPDQVDVAV